MQPGWGGARSKPACCQPIEPTSAKQQNRKAGPLETPLPTPGRPRCGATKPPVGHIAEARSRLATRHRAILADNPASFHHTIPRSGLSTYSLLHCCRVSVATLPGSKLFHLVGDHLVNVPQKSVVVQLSIQGVLDKKRPQHLLIRNNQWAEVLGSGKLADLLHDQGDSLTLLSFRGQGRPSGAGEGAQRLQGDHAAEELLAHLAGNLVPQRQKNRSLPRIHQIHAIAAHGVHRALDGGWQVNIVLHTGGRGDIFVLPHQGYHSGIQSFHCLLHWQGEHPQQADQLRVQASLQLSELGDSLQIERQQLHGLRQDQMRSLRVLGYLEAVHMHNVHTVLHQNISSTCPLLGPSQMRVELHEHGGHSVTI
mmetsp:Transcript_49379/g.107797  ORF Transcript_49379/g.107797 Transcript_49379/m.107797 type:complete len:366 (-) Transcript_49379:1022-2119(-)